MPRIIDSLRASLVLLLLFQTAASLGAQNAYLSQASMEEDRGAPGEYLYRLEIGYADGHPGIEPKASVGEAAGIEIMSLAVKPVRKEKSEILIRFRAASASGWTFPELQLSWMAERLTIPPRAGPAASVSASASSDPGIGSRTPQRENLPPWKNATRPDSAAAARAIGDFTIKASLDRTSAGPGDIAYLEFSLEGSGDFFRAGAPRARVVSGKAKLGAARRYPDYDPESGQGRLLFRFPLEAKVPGSVVVAVEAYPVYDPVRGALMPDSERRLSLRVPEPESAAADAMPDSDLSVARKGPMPRTILIAAALALACCLGIAGIVFLRSNGRRRLVPGFILLGLCAVSAAVGGALALTPEPLQSFDSELRLGQGLRIYSVPSEKARFWTSDGAYARITGRSEAENGEVWFSVILEDSSSGWIRSVDAGKAKAAP